ncbi:cell division protein FtsL [Moorella sp. Hama-1]|nr:cell division protein FtsL [Moorella sp. Hama-1]
MIAAPREAAYMPGPVTGSKYSLRTGAAGRHQKTGARQKVILLGLVLLAIITGLALTFLSMQLVIKGYKIDSIKQELGTLQRENEQLQLEVARLKAPERVARVATAKLGMIEPQTEQIYYVPDKAGTGKQVQVAAAAPAGTAVTSPAPGGQSWWVALTEALHQWLGPGRPARAGA